MSDNLIGQPTRRKEDARFLTGRGRFTDDIVLEHQSYAAIVRSPHANARIRGIDASRAKAVAGVLGVFTGADMAADKIGPSPAGWLIKSKDGSPMVEPPHVPICHERAAYEGEPVAVVVAESIEIARLAATLVDVDYEPLPAVITIEDAVRDGAPLVWSDAKNNLCYDWEFGDKAGMEAAFAKAAHITKIDLVQNRITSNTLEPRAANGDFNPSTGDYTLYSTTQLPHVIRLFCAAFVLHIPEHKLRVVAPDVGGGFGAKAMQYPEESIVLWCAAKVKRPVKWTATRTESFYADVHSRDHVTHAELALDANGKFLALRVKTYADMGAYLTLFAPAVPTYLYGTVMAGTYTTPAVYTEVKAVFTNTVPVDAYRGAGRPEATYVIERIVDQAARELRMDPLELRRRNFIPKEAFPYQTPVALCYDSGDYHTLLDLATEAADWKGFEARREEAKERGKWRGIGVSAYVEASGLAPSNIAGALGARAGFYESAKVRVNPTGGVVCFTGSHSHGQGHETSFAQLVATKLGISIDQVEIVHGDTSNVPFGMGTYGSRSMSVGGAALAAAVDKVIDKGKKIAAHLLEADSADIEFEGGAFKVAGTDRSLPWGAVAFTAYVPHNFPLDKLEPGLEETAYYDPKNFTYPSGVHVCELEVDMETFDVDVVRFSVADDFGKIVNPMIVEGQVQGGVAQGIGQALYEQILFEDGKLRTTSWDEYAMPRARQIPAVTSRFNETLCTHNPLGAKGAGEAGTIGSMPAIMNALIDALAHLGIRRLDMPATPERLWRAVRSAQQKGT